MFLLIAALLVIQSDPTPLREVTETELMATIEACIDESQVSQFERREDAAARLAANSCALNGKFRRSAPTLPGLGHIISYDAERQAFIYVVVPDPFATTNYGGGSTIFSSQYPGGIGAPSHIRRVITDIGNQAFWLFPLVAEGDVTDTYTASNAYGAQTQVVRHRGTRYSISVPTRWGSRGRGQAQLVAEFPIAAADAAEVADYLDIEIELSFQRPCEICFSGGVSEKGNSTPTRDSPYDLILEHRWAFATVTSIRLLDRRSGLVLAQDNLRLN